MDPNLRESNLALNRFVRTARCGDGFTLVEILFVIAIIGILSMMSIRPLEAFYTKVRSARAASEIRGLEKDIISFAIEKGKYPTLADIADTATNPSLAALKNLKDPWGHNYVYSDTPTRFYGAMKNTDFDLYSKGQDGDSADDLIDLHSLDDIIRFKDGAYDDLAGKFP